jgi:hypothetical protein
MVNWSLLVLTSSKSDLKRWLKSTEAIVANKKRDRYVIHGFLPLPSGAHRNAKKSKKTDPVQLLLVPVIRSAVGLFSKKATAFDSPAGSLESLLMGFN